MAEIQGGLCGREVPAPVRLPVSASCPRQDTGEARCREQPAAGDTAGYRLALHTVCILRSISVYMTPNPGAGPGGILLQCVCVIKEPGSPVLLRSPR
ncbi:hypothetical protein FKM82_027101 [Ascaphus truei]